MLFRPSGRSSTAWRYAHQMGWALQHLKDAYFAGLPAYVRRRLQGEIEGGNAVKRRFRPVEEAELVTCPNCFGQVVVKGVCVKCGIAGLGAWTANPFRPSAGLVGMDELDYELRDLKKYPRPETDARARFELLLGFIAADPCLIRIALRLLEDPAITFTEAAEGERISGYKFRKLRGALAESARQKGADEILEGRLKSQVTHPSRSAMMGVRLPLRLGKRKQFSTLVADVIVSTAPERTISGIGPG